MASQPDAFSQRDNKMDDIYEATPGTEILYDTGKDGVRDLHRLQHLKKGDTHILLVPQPSLVDPNDPLRWPSWKKYATLANAMAYSFLGGVTGPIMAGMMIYLSTFYGVSLQKVTYANGATLVCQGVGNILWMPFAVKYGRRPVYILSNTLMAVACMWLGVESEGKYTNFLIARAFLGLFEAPIESIVPSTIRDIFFLHHRGTFLASYALSVLGGNEIGPMFSAIIFQAIGAKWAFYIVGIFIFATSVTMVLFMPETLYLGERPSIRFGGDMDDAQDTGTKQVVEQVEGGGVSSGRSESKSESKPESKPEKPSATAPGHMATHSFLRSLSFWHTCDPKASLWKEFLKPFVLFTYPTVLWGCVVYGCSLGWNVIMGATVAQLFAPQYGFGAMGQGLVFLAPFVGSLVGTWLCGPLADRIANYYTIRNDGVREPEMRLPTCAMAAVVTFLGALMAALTYHHDTHWMGPVVGFAVLTAGGQIGATLAMNYALDCHAELSVELMVAVATLKSLIAWIYTWVINDWITADGMLTVFMIIAAINVVVYLTTIPLYLYGKRIRAWIARTDALGRLGLRQ